MRSHLVKRVVDPDGNTGLAAIDQAIYLYDQGQVALEFHKQGSGTVPASGLMHRYLWNPAAVDQLLADEQVTSLAAAGQTYWMLSDHLGSIRDVVDSNGTVRIHRDFDSFGNIVEEIHYDVDGVTEVDPNEAGYVDEAFAFTGRFLDDETGLQNNLNRWYDPATGRWTSEDPIGFLAGDANLNRYVGNEPVGYIDPLGLATGKFVGVLAGDPYYAGEPWRERREKIEDIDPGFLERVTQLPHEPQLPQQDDGSQLSQGPPEPTGLNKKQRQYMKYLDEMDELAKRHARGDYRDDQRFANLLRYFGSRFSDFEDSMAEFSDWSHRVQVGILSENYRFPRLGKHSPWELLEGTRGALGIMDAEERERQELFRDEYFRMQNQRVEWLPAP